MNKNGIVVRLWTSIVLMIIVLFLLTLVFQTQFLYIFNLSEERYRLEEAAEKISKHYLNSEYDFNAPVNVAGKKPYELIIVTDENRVIRALHGETSSYEVGDYFGRNYISEILDGKVVSDKNYIINNKINNLESLLVGVPIKKTNLLEQNKQPNIDDNTVGFSNSTTINGAVYIISPMEYLESPIKALQQMFLYIFIGAIIIASTMSYFLAQSFSKPLIDINIAAIELSKGNYNTFIDIQSGSEEIKNLGNTINNLTKQLSRVEQIRKEFIANVSHEIRTPLSYLQGYTEIMLDGLAETEEERYKYLNIILDESKRLRNMVNEILQLSQIEAGYVQLKLAPFSIDSVIKRIIEKLYPFATQRNISIKYNNISDDVFLCLADEGQIKQVLINLINNAIKHSFDYSNILINAYKQNDRTYICVRDFGEGISEEDLPFIWDRFYTVNKTKSENSTGLGLSIVRNIINAHNTEVTVNSVKGEGTEFCFWLQCYNERL